ncbi:Retrovirus-related Pol polyprotein from transposon TNT 1-94 [Morella rubra]|uniref:Retrovirus-related Pol polyprotein from transposon TNT 1-94 n=1 Tax=Morella rubra TaxID=262757 RepID=A0A6A1W0Z6_9ROSI|nr:Retrovirus-related Pol polyprotein from transposon TNT 1-94 [Morella rubra]
MELVKDALFSEEARRKEMETYDHNGSQALITERGRESSKNTRGQDKSRGMGRKITCLYCYQEGHTKRNCPKYKAEKGK